MQNTFCNNYLAFLKVLKLSEILNLNNLKLVNNQQKANAESYQ